MRNHLAKALLIVLLAMPIVIALGQSVGNVSAKQFEFKPGKIRVQQGDVIEVTLTSTDDIPHGFGIRAFNVNERVNKGEVKVFRFTASKAGTYPIVCTVFCGLGHGSMRGELIVE